MGGNERERRGGEEQTGADGEKGKRISKKRREKKSEKRSVSEESEDITRKGDYILETLHVA